MAANEISWQNTLWASGDTYVAFSMIGASIMVQDVDTLYDANNNKINEQSTKKSYTVTLATDGTSGSANLDGFTSGTLLGTSEVAVQEGNKVAVRSLNLAQSAAWATWSLKLASGSMEEVDGSKLTSGISVQVDAFGDKGTITLGSGADRVFVKTGLAGTAKKITVDGGAGNDTISANSNVLTYKLASYDSSTHSLAGTPATSESDFVNGFAEKSTIQLASGRKFSEIEVSSFSAFATATDGAFVLGLAESDSTHAGIKTNFSLGTRTSASLVQVNFANDSGTRNAIIYGSTVAGGKTVTISAAQASATSLYIGAQHAGAAGAAGTGDNTAILELNGKKNIFLGHQEGTGEQFGDTSLYVNVKKVSAGTDGSRILGNLTTSDDKGDLLINGGTGAVSLCGIGGAADTLKGNVAATQTKFTTFGTLTNAGTDVVTNYHFGNAQDSTADKILFIDGLDLSKTKATTDNKLYMGVNAKDGVAIDISNAPNSGNDGVYVQYLLGVDSKDAKTALVDVKGGKTLEFDATKATTYIGGITGQEADQTTLSLGTSQVSLGFDADCFNGKAAKYQSYGMSSIDGSSTAVNSIINGSADNAETIQASKSANSFVCGGFAGELADTGADTLIGSGSNTISTEFFVGKDLGSDTILNLSSLDKINFINTSHNDVNVVSSGNSLIATTGTTKIVATCVSSSIGDIKDVTFQFTDGAIKWTGSGWENA